MKTILQILFFIITVTLVSCDDVFQLPEYNHEATSMEDLSVSEDFTWSTVRNVAVEIIGLPSPKNVKPVTNTLILSDGVNTYYTGLHAINENHKMVLSVPSDINVIKLKFGSIERVAEIKNNIVSLSMIPVIN